MQPQDTPLRTAQQRLDWLLAHPDTSPWLKSAIAGAQQRDPLDVWNDLELLDCALRFWCDAALSSR